MAKSDSRAQQLWPYKKLRKLIWLDYSKTPTFVPSTPGELPSCRKIFSWPEESAERELESTPQTKITVLSGPPIPPKGDNLKSYLKKCKSLQKKKATVKNKEMKLFLMGNALSKQIPLKVNGFAKTRSFLHLYK